MAATYPVPITRTRVLLVEGSDEDNFFSSLLASVGSFTDVQIVKMNGVKNLSPTLNLVSKNVPKVERIGIVRDVDDSSENAFKSVTDILANQGLAKPGVVGLFTSESPSIGVFIMPGEGRAGALETLCLEALTADEIMGAISLSKTFCSS